MLEPDIVLRVRDNGRGFQPDRVRRERLRDGGLGLLAMGERVSVLGGTLSVLSAPGAGATIEVQIRRDGAGYPPATRSAGEDGSICRSGGSAELGGQENDHPD
jgi:signal transduction histidine kinase